MPDYANAKANGGSVVIEVGEPVKDRTERRVELDPNEDEIGNQADKPSQTSQLGGKAPLEILAMLGAKGETAVQPEKLEEYRRIFGFLDANDDGNLSTKEFVEDGRYMTRETRQGIFTASDADRDGIVSEQEYVTNRIITDEAKTIAVIKMRAECPDDVVELGLAALTRNAIAVGDSGLSSDVKSEWDVSIEKMRMKLESLES